MVDIGANGFVGIGLELLVPPVATSATPSGTGGTLAAGVYKYYITARNARGETTVSNELSATTTGSTSSVVLLWALVTDATDYRIFRTAVDGATGTELYLATVTAPTVTYTDTAPGTPTGAFPKINTAATPGVYAAPTKFFPLESESLTLPQQTNWRRPVMQTADIIGAVAGEHHVEGDIGMEVLEDVIPYFLSVARYVCVKTGSSPNFVYTFTPLSTALAPRSMSVTIVRNGQVFGFVGCQVSKFKLSVDNGLYKVTWSILGFDEGEESIPMPTFTSTTPYGLGSYTIEIPQTTVVGCGIDTFSFDVDDSGTAEPRLCGTGQGAKIIYFGERNTKLSTTRDFEDRDDFDAYKALTSQSLKILASKGSNNSVELNAGVMIKDTYQVSLNGQGELLRAQIEYMLVRDPSTSRNHQIVVKTQENMV